MTPVNENSTRQKILENAIQCVTKDRNATHGNPENNFQTIADLWVAYLKARNITHIGCNRLNSVDVAAMMVLMKTSRLTTSPGHSDHWTDIAGYAACGGEIACQTHPPYDEPKTCGHCKSIYSHHSECIYDGPVGPGEKLKSMCPECGTTGPFLNCTSPGCPMCSVPAPEATGTQPPF